ncbi:hypothetical protein T440DRAFT_555526 [Plenodomus tracheiphilus IPT5]|uniref:Uncharacterized protein n=1 Tax=Plenodomus tracheiphilus IPT5 TaxID=1408161 RepID=A0A6A7B3E1_9PLEO|nr:hypothetical protein T440DRAFT_555526 [Plenodomus tracheiphilus IPT5]
MASIDNSSSSITAWSDSADLEQGPLNIDRFVLRIRGLKSCCCGTSITRALNRIQPINKHQLNLVTARLDLDLDTSRLSLAEVIKQLNDKTGYTFEQHVASAGQALVLGTSDYRRLQQAAQPYGVSHLEVPEKDSWLYLQRLSGRSSTNPCEAPPTRVRTARLGSDATIAVSEGEESLKLEVTSSFSCQLVQIHFDANTIGARDLFEHYRRYDPLLKLAPPPASATLGVQLVRRSMYSFLAALALTFSVLVLAWTPLESMNPLNTHVSLALATGVQVIAFHDFAVSAARTLYNSRMFEMDALITLSTSVAYTLGVVSYIYQLKGKPLDTGSSFETSALLVTLILFGRVLVEFARYKSAKSVSFRSLQMTEALLVKADSTAPNDPNPKTKTIDARLLQHGDRVKVPPHTIVVTDGVVICGGSEIDEVKVTGEPIPVAKGVQSMVYAGTKNGSGTLIVELTALPHDNSVHRAAALVEDVELLKPKIQALVDRIAAWSIPIVASVGLVVFLTWLFTERYHQHPWTNAVITATTHAISTLLVCCPYAINLPIPLITTIATTISARHGIIFRNTQALLKTRLVTDIVLDKPNLLKPTLTAKLLARGIAIHPLCPKNKDQKSYIRNLQRRKGSMVLYCTMDNNTNDAMPLQQADISLALNDTTHIPFSNTTVKPDIILISPHSGDDILALMRISRMVFRRVVGAVANAEENERRDER